MTTPDPVRTAAEQLARQFPSGDCLCDQFVDDPPLCADCRLFADAIEAFARQQRKEAEQRWQEIVSDEREDAAQWLREHDIERKRAEAAEARIAVLEAALDAITAAHEGYQSGMGPCVCKAHQEARSLLRKLEGSR